MVHNMVRRWTFWLPGIDPIILYQTGLLETSEQLALQYLKFFGRPFILFGSVLVLLAATTRSVGRIPGNRNRKIAARLYLSCLNKYTVIWLISGQVSQRDLFIPSNSSLLEMVFRYH